MASLEWVRNAFGVGTWQEPSGNGGSSPFTIARVPLSAADIKAITPDPGGAAELIASPGPGKVLVVLPGFSDYEYGGIAYTSVGSPIPIIGYDNGLGDPDNNWTGVYGNSGIVGMQDLTADRLAELITNQGFGGHADFEDLPIALGFSGAALVDGNGTLTLTIPYYVVTLT